MSFRSTTLKAKVNSVFDEGMKIFDEFMDAFDPKTSTTTTTKTTYNTKITLSKELLAKLIEGKYLTFKAGDDVITVCVKE